MNSVWDPLRKKELAATPEEVVRQWFISQLAETFRVPSHLMMSEVSLKFGQKKYRADILVYDRNGAPLAVVECKRPDVALTAAVIEQAMRYNIVLGVDWLMLTNGQKTFIYRKEGNCFKPFDTVPDYDTMVCGR